MSADREGLPEVRQVGSRDSQAPRPQEVAFSGQRSAVSGQQYKTGIGFDFAES
jgi:hypothetical protein